MKKQLFSILFILTNILSYSQIDTLSDGVYIYQGNLGIGTNTPEADIHIKKPLPRIVTETNDGNFLRFGAGTSGSSITFNDDKSLWIEGRENFNTGQVTDNGLLIQGDGNIGIATRHPRTRLEIAKGDIFISEIEKGIIMKSPDGNCWRGVLDNSGQLNFTIIDCPEEGPSVKIQQQESSPQLMVFPNPTGKILTIQLAINRIENAKYRIYNLKGQLEVSGRINSDCHHIDISAFNKGIYILNIYDKYDNKFASEKINKE
ncbi:T9SS type A sorting domain-containing protein [Lentimicrobium sp. L6]|uniref:T9SS type A sorting domain-containing protein n=1 Tax=Lentimicrobium sp. L6 TaxID=2735916 RepID=UPI0015549A39|nr:T9SS type A sorting domain-containing protein [Lentimicrobium sp. L6]NPD83991.1 T9SS type A sorting domain-containing protein [Lentimicrobium sp. L6]